MCYVYWQVWNHKQTVYLQVNIVYLQGDNMFWNIAR